jgi:hypothetical protein
MSVYDRLQATATRLLTNYGVLTTFTRSTKGSYNPLNGTHSVTNSTYDKYIVKDKWSFTERADSSIEEGDIKYIAEQGAYEKGDTLTVDGDVYRVFMIDPITPAETNCAVILGVRK